MASLQRDHLVSGRTVPIYRPIWDPEVSEPFHRSESVAILCGRPDQGFFPGIQDDPGGYKMHDEGKKSLPESEPLAKHIESKQTGEKSKQNTNHPGSPSSVPPAFRCFVTFYARSNLIHRRY